MGEDTMGEATMGEDMVAGVAAVAAGWAWDVDTDMDVDMVREDPIGSTSGTQDFTGPARMVVRALEGELGDASTQE